MLAQRKALSMRIDKIVFSIAKTTPLYPLTGDPDDQYANVKPFASCTIEFEPKDVTDPKTKIGQATIAKAYDQAQEVCVGQLAKFHRDFKKMVRGK